MATNSRLRNDDVLTIFDCLHQNKYPPSHLQFNIVSVGPNGLKLSPPPIEFENGFFILLQPEKKSKSGSTTLNKSASRVPSNLTSLVSQNLIAKSKPCQWSLSGPQFPKSTSIQQRYSYPKERGLYSKNKGASLWTMYKNGKEDLEYRLLHVYFSSKRATNQNIKNGKGYGSNISTIHKKAKLNKHESLVSPSTISFSSSTGYDSPALYSNHYRRPPTYQHTRDISFSPSNNKYNHANYGYFKNSFSPNYACPQNCNYSQGRPALPYFSTNTRFNNYPMQHEVPIQYRVSPSTEYRQIHKEHTEQVREERELVNTTHSKENRLTICPSPKTTDNSRHEVKATLDYETTWSPVSFEPLPFDEKYVDSSFSFQNSWDADADADADADSFLETFTQTDAIVEDRVKGFLGNLNAEHKKIQSNIKSYPKEEQEKMIQVISNWANQVAKDPMGSNRNLSSL